MAEVIRPGGYTVGIGATRRRDAWWVQPVLVLLGLTAFIAYATWAALQGAHYWYGSYLSPFPGLFRVTCYYYRKAYYRAFAWTPPACAVQGLPRRNYKGERGLLVIQNLHRYALYPALAYIVILYYDAGVAFFRDGELTVGVGSLVLLTNATLLAGYTFGCHAFRHLVGGGTDCFSCSHARHSAWKKVSVLNARHSLWAWMSLFWVAFSDLYVRLVSMGIWTDLIIY